MLALDEPVRHPWLGKSYLGRFLGTRLPSAHTVMWIDADAFFNSPLPPLAPLIEGYDLLLDAHVQSVGELTHGSNLKRLGLRPDDAYFSAGWWIARPGRLFETYERLTALVRGQGHLWECDAFVAAIYAERLRIRTVSGLVWHARGKTSLGSCGVRDTTAYHGDQPIYVVHANDSYTVRDDGRRVLDRPDLARLQDRYEQRYRERIGIPSASGTRGPHPFVTGRG